MSIARQLVIVGLAAGLVLVSGPAEAAEVCGSQACVSGAEWSSGEQLDDAARKREAKRNRKGKAAQLTVQLNGGRGSLFVDGVWIAPVPALYVPIKPGKHDVEVRDGQNVLARGVLSVPKKGGEITIRVF